MRHMRDHAQEAVDILSNKSLEELGNDRVLQLALVQLIEIVGEAALAFQTTSAVRTRRYHGNWPQECATS
jgi:hypothetical protein